MKNNKKKIFLTVHSIIHCNVTHLDKGFKVWIYLYRI